MEFAGKDAPRLIFVQVPAPSLCMTCMFVSAESLPSRMQFVSAEGCCVVAVAAVELQSPTAVRWLATAVFMPQRVRMKNPPKPAKSPRYHWNAATRSSETELAVAADVTMARRTPSLRLLVAVIAG